MKKLILFSLVATFLVSCSQEQKMKSEIKEYVNTNFNDPKSYDPVEFKVIETVSSYSYAQNKIEEHKKNIEINQKAYLKDPNEAYKTLIDMDKLQIEIYKDSFKSKEPRCYIATHKYRARNAMGALILEEKAFLFDKNYKLVGVYDYNNSTGSDLDKAVSFLISKG